MEKLESIIFGLKEELKELKAENEKIRMHNDQLRDEVECKQLEIERVNGYFNTACGRCDELQEEIERLTEENGQLKGYNNGLEYENAELQKQVDKAWFEVGKMCMEERKDTAKEILQYMETLKVEEDGRHQWRDEHNNCIERISCKIHQKFVNGVEVE